MSDLLNVSCLILAAGDGKRMFASSSKVLCEVGYKPMILWVADAARAAGIDSLAAVVSAADVEKALPESFSVYYQKERLGTGHAVMCAREFLGSNAGGDTLILYGDAPFIDPETISGSLRLHRESGAAVTVISAEVADPTGYGRIVRRDGQLAAIVEHRDCDDASLAINEVNSGAGWFKTDDLLYALERIGNDNSQGEYYLTDAVGILLSAGKQAVCYKAPSSDVILGANSPLELLGLNDIAAERAIVRHLAGGVHFVKRDGVIIGPDVQIAPGATILPGTVLYGATKIGSGSVIGPNSILKDVAVGENTHFNSSQGFESAIGNNVKIGPYVQLRPGSVIEDSVKIGDFVEVKNSRIGEGTSLAHLTYIGDSDIGRYCNFGCGVVVVNYDGEKKQRTVVKDYAFIGCNTNLVAPVMVGEGAYTAAGTTVTKDIPDGALAIDRSPLIIKVGWATRKLRAYVEKKRRLQKHD